MITAGVLRPIGRLFQSLMLVFVIAALPACMTQSSRPQASDLATTGATTMGAIANYYLLVETTYESGIRDEYLLFALNVQMSVCTKLPGSKPCKDAIASLPQKMQDRAVDLAAMRTGLDSRRRLAVEIQALYSKFGAMAGEDIEPTFGAQGQSLVEAISKVANTPLPGAVGGEIFKEIGVQIQNHTLGRGELGIRKVITAFNDQFGAEMPAWDTVFKNREDAIPFIVQRLLELDVASSAELAGKVLEDYSLTAGSKSLVDFPATENVLIGWAAMDSYRLTEDSRTAVAAARQGLNSLVAAHQSFPKSDGSLASAIDAASRLNAIVDAFDSWKKEQAAEKKAAADTGAAGSP